tara:strand:- start:60 stop:647 length:588 start_codon:yes stop_codon:yes gene_type:complete
MPGYLSAYRRRQDNRLREQNQRQSSTQSIERAKAIHQIQKEKAKQNQERIQKVKSIFETDTDYPTNPNKSIELQDWVAFGICIAAFLLVVHFFVGWWTILGASIVSLNVFLFYIELQQKSISLADQSVRACQPYRVPPSLIHGTSVVLQLLLLLGYLWLPHWISIVVQLCLSTAAIFLLHTLRNLAPETIFKKKN